MRAVILRTSVNEMLLQMYEIEVAKIHGELMKSADRKSAAFKPEQQESLVEGTDCKAGSSDRQDIDLSK